jgi:hypothetical protein
MTCVLAARLFRELSVGVGVVLGELMRVGRVLGAAGVFEGAGWREVFRGGVLTATC